MSSSLARRAPAALLPCRRPLLRCTSLAPQNSIGCRRRMHLGSVGEALGSVVTSTAEGLSSLHGAGLPWYVCIPLAAAGVNFSIRLPLQYYARRLLLERVKLNPLVSAWASRHNAAAQPIANGGRAEMLRSTRVAGKIEKSRARLYKTWGVQRWKGLAPLLGIFPFVLVSESLRRLSGAPLGALSQALGLGKAGSSAAEAAASSPLFDASLSQGGALWFTDLTAMDPYYALPVLCSVILARNSWFRMPKERLRALLSIDDSKAPVAPIVKIQMALGRALLAIPFFPLLFADLPSAIFLYWAASFSLTQVNETILDKLYPLPPTKKSSGQKQTTQQVMPFLLETRGAPPVQK